MYVYVFIIVILVIIAYIFIFYNSLIKLDNKVKEAFSTMDVYLKKRWDLIPNLVQVVKGYSTYEADSLINIIEIRNKNYNNMSNDEKIKSNEIITNELSKIFVLNENYPELKANENYIKLSDNLVKVEEDIANSRKYYNAIVRIYNNKIEMFPNSLIAKIIGYKSKKMFQIEKDERENVKVKL